MKKIMLALILGALSVNGYPQTTTIESINYEGQNATSPSKQKKVKMPKSITKEEQDRMDKIMEEDRKEKLIPPLERAMRDLRKPCPPHYESKHIKMTLVKNEEGFSDYMDSQGTTKKQRKILIAEEEVQFLDEEGKIIKRITHPGITSISSEEKKKYRQEFPESNIEKLMTSFYIREGILIQREDYGYTTIETGFESVYPSIKIFDANEKLLTQINGEGMVSISPDIRYVVATDPYPPHGTAHVAFYDMKGKLLNAMDYGGGYSQTLVYSENGDYVGAEIGDTHALLFNRNGRLLWNKDVDLSFGGFVWISDNGNALMGNAEYIDNKGDIIWHAESLGQIHSNKIIINKKKERLMLLGIAHNTDKIVLVDFRTGRILDEINLDRGIPIGFIGQQIKIIGFDTKIYVYDVQW